MLEREIGHQGDGNALEVCVTETGEEGLGCQTLSIQHTATPFEHSDQIPLIVWPKLQFSIDLWAYQQRAGTISLTLPIVKRLMFRTANRARKQRGPIFLLQKEAFHVILELPSLSDNHTFTSPFRRSIAEHDT